MNEKNIYFWEKMEKEFLIIFSSSLASVGVVIMLVGFTCSASGIFWKIGGVFIGLSCCLVGIESLTNLIYRKFPKFFL